MLAGRPCPDVAADGACPGVAAGRRPGPVLPARVGAAGGIRALGQASDRARRRPFHTRAASQATRDARPSSRSCLADREEGWRAQAAGMAPWLRRDSQAAPVFGESQSRLGDHAGRLRRRCASYDRNEAVSVAHAGGGTHIGDVTCADGDACPVRRGGLELPECTRTPGDVRPAWARS